MAGMGYGAPVIAEGAGDFLLWQAEHNVAEIHGDLADLAALTAASGMHESRALKNYKYFLRHPGNGMAQDPAGGFDRDRMFKRHC
ncbi:hypothetical protein RvVAR031_12950 [Agrobacterium vitis]|nr:hypothetical protein RvVAR031_12950 [Agrobacterium vitis]